MPALDRPASSSAFFTSFTNLFLVRPPRASSLKNGPGPVFLSIMYAKIACTGQMPMPELSSTTCAPLLRRSVLDCLMQTRTLSLPSRSPTSTSVQVRWAPASNSSCSGARASPALRQPKKHRQAAAHSILPFTP